MKKILIIDDEVTYVHIVKTALEPLETEILHATNGKQGFDIVMQHHPDLILLDLYMPEENGMDFLEDLRKDPRGKEVNVVILTNIDYKETIDKAQALGVEHYLIKATINPGVLISTVKQLLP